MVFSSFNFLFLFLPLLLAIYYVIPRRCRRTRNGVLLVFSLFFYGCGGWSLLPLILLSIAVNWAGGLLCAPGRKHARAAMVVTVVVNLALLGWFKYAVFTAETINALGLSLPVPSVTLPIGISFFTFQGMSYVLDVWRGDAPRERSPFRVGLYIALFPQLVAGPIVRYTTVAEEIADRRESREEFAAGLTRFLFGLAKKLLIANAVGELADLVWGLPADELSTVTAWLGALAYTAQIYFDFSGYSDMAIGLGRMFGFHFLENFEYPYIARSVTEFWRRWHISLSTWFRDYLYIPLGGSRCSRARQIFNLLVVWTLTGLWHGAAWNFVLWGMYYAVLLIGERYLWGRGLDRLPAALRHVYALLIVVCGWVLFRAESLAGVGRMFAAMFGTAPFWDGQALYCVREYGWALALAAAASLPLRDWARAALEKRAPPVVVWAPKILALGLLVLCYMRLIGSTFNPFIYFRF